MTESTETPETPALDKPKTVTNAAVLQAVDALRDDFTFYRNTMSANLLTLEDQMAADIKAVDTRLDGMATGINQIGEMMNWVVEETGKLMQQMQNGGLMGMLSSMRKGGKTDE